MEIDSPEVALIMIALVVLIFGSSVLYLWWTARRIERKRAKEKLEG